MERGRRARTRAPVCGRDYCSSSSDMRRGFYSAGARKTLTRPAAEPAPLPDTTKRDVTEPRSRAWRSLYKRAERPLLFAGGGLAAVALVALHASFTPAAPP